MSNAVQILAIVVSSLLLALVLELVRRRKLTEEHSFIWILCSLALLVLSIWRELMHTVAAWLGIFYPPMVLLLVLIFFVFVALLYFSVVISTQRSQIEQLMVEVAVLSAREPEGRTPDGRTPEGRTPDGRTPGGRTPEEEVSEDGAPEGRTSEGWTLEDGIGGSGSVRRSGERPGEG
jgi:hypothetical protein